MKSPDIIVRPGVPELMRGVVRGAVKRLAAASPLIGHLRIVLIAAREIPEPDTSEYWCGMFVAYTKRCKHPTIYLCTLVDAEDLEDTLAHEWGHYEQWRDGRPQHEGQRIARRTRRLMRAIRRET